MLDQILGNATDLPIAEHAIDTHGASLANFILTDDLGTELRGSADIPYPRTCWYARLSGS